MKADTGLVTKAGLLGIDKPRKAKDCPQPPEARGGEERPSPKAFRGSLAWGRLDERLLASRTPRRWVSVVLSHPAVVLGRSSPRRLRQPSSVDHSLPCLQHPPSDSGLSPKLDWAPPRQTILFFWTLGVLEQRSASCGLWATSSSLPDFVNIGTPSHPSGHVLSVAACQPRSWVIRDHVANQTLTPRPLQKRLARPYPGPQ